MSWDSLLGRTRRWGLVEGVEEEEEEEEEELELAVELEGESDEEEIILFAPVGVSELEKKEKKVH